MNSYITLFLLWFLFYGLHSAMAASVVKEMVQRTFPPFVKPYRMFYNVVSLLLFGWVYVYQISLQSTLLIEEIWVHNLGAILVLVSIVLMYVSFKNYDIKEFIGMSQWRNNSFNAAISEQLQIRGLNRYIRHPLYTACYLFFVAYFLYKPFLGSAIFSFMGFVYLYFGAKWEEQKLVKQFGSDYLTYQEQTPMFFPRMRG